MANVEVQAAIRSTTSFGVPGAAASGIGDGVHDLLTARTRRRERYCGSVKRLRLRTVHWATLR
jgi:hypothetical protein